MGTRKRFSPEIRERAVRMAPGIAIDATEGRIRRRPVRYIMYEQKLSGCVKFFSEQGRFSSYRAFPG